MENKKQMRVGEQRGYRPQEVVNTVKTLPAAGQRTVTAIDVGEVKADEQLVGLLKRTRERLGLSDRPAKG